MNKIFFTCLLLIATAVCSGAIDKPAAGAHSGAAMSSPVSGPFSDPELREFAALAPIDSHTHVYKRSPAFYAMLKELNLHILDILVDDDTIPEYANFTQEAKDGWAVFRAGDGRVAFCTTFNAYKFSQPDFSAVAIRKLNQDFARGAVAVKFYKVVGMEIKDSEGNYILPDDPVFEPIFKDIAAHNKTLIAHLADPDSVWEAPNPAAPDYDYLMQDPRRFMYGKADAPTKAEILKARDHILENRSEFANGGSSSRQYGIELRPTCQPFR